MTLQRHMTPWHRNPRPWAFADVAEGTPLSEILAGLNAGIRNLMLVMRHNARSAEWWHEPTQHLWRISNYANRPRRAEYERADGRKVAVICSDAWSPRIRDARTARVVFAKVGFALAREFDTGISLMGTPARTGLDLLLRSLPTRRDGTPYEYEPIPAELAALLANQTQGRIEFIGEPRTVNELVCWDARWMYAACVRRLPVGPWTFDHQIDVADFRPGFYQVAFQPAEGAPGMLCARDEHGVRSWPTTPGKWYETVATDGEMRMATVAGYKLSVHGRWLAAPDNRPGADPGRGWLERLVRLRAKATGDVHAAILRDIYRALLIQPIGAWARGSASVLHVTPYAEQHTIPADALSVRVMPNLRTPRYVEWYSRGALDPALQRWYRPEWSAMVWGRANQRLATALLQVPRGNVVAVRNDALILSAPQPDGIAPRAPESDPERPGTWRVKWRVQGPLAAPLDETSYRAMLQRAGEHADEGSDDE